MVEGKKPRAKTGEAIPAEMRRPEDIAELEAFLRRSKAKKKHDEVLRFRAVLGYIDGQSVASMTKTLKTLRSVINKWLRWYVTAGAEGLLTQARPGAPTKLTAEQMQELARIVKDGPIAAGYTSGVWTGPMVGDLVLQRFGVRYHFEYIPRLLNKLQFSVQRPRKRLARADADAQRVWVEERLPEIKKKPKIVAG
jgi:transposase